MDQLFESKGKDFVYEASPAISKNSLGHIYRLKILNYTSADRYLKF